MSEVEPEPAPAGPAFRLPPAAAWALVGAQGVFLLLLAFLPWGDLWPRGIGTIILGIALAVVGFGIGIGIGFGIGLVVIGASVPHVLAWVALLAVLMTKSRFEERMLAAQYPDYAPYAARVSRLVPGVGRIRSARP